MMQTTEESTGITYGALIGFVIAVVATLGLTGGAGFYLAKSIKNDPAAVVPASPSTTKPVRPITIFDLQGTAPDDDVQQAATSPFEPNSLDANVSTTTTLAG